MEEDARVAPPTVLSLPAMPSLDLILEQVRDERAGQLSHADALDGKAGLVLGFAGVLITLGISDVANSWPVVMGMLFTALSGLLALAAFVPRPYQRLKMRHLRDAYLTHTSDYTKLRLLDTMIYHAENNAVRTRWKARFLYGAFLALATAVVFLSVGALIPGDNYAERSGTGVSPAASSASFQS
jgi:hypothetical protein